jgi:hypothetical protein
VYACSLSHYALLLFIYNTIITVQWEISLVQNFLATALEEIFVVLIFAPSPRGDHTHIDRPAISWFIFSQRQGLIDSSAQSINEKREIFALCDNFPLYGM